jgi:hypothetical protein
MRRGSRLSKYEQRKAVTYVFIAVSGIFLIFISAIYFLPQIILGTSSLASKISTKNIVRESKKEDIKAPLPPKLDSLPYATSKKSITITGTAPAKSTIKLYVNDIEVKKVAVSNDESFEFESILLKEGENTIYATATDNAGNTSKKSTLKTIIVKTEGPQLEASEQVDQENARVKISGATDSDATVSINDRRVIVSRNGSFSTELKLNSGENKFLVISTDLAGNKTEKEIVVNYSPEDN